jgi:cystathionine beta-lyase/cystathionine gamma-synthase
VSRGLRTLALRVVRQNSNALELARFLARSPKVLRVHHPGLEASPYHQRAQALFANGGCGGVFSFGGFASGCRPAAPALLRVRSARCAGLHPKAKAHPSSNIPDTPASAFTPQRPLFRAG